MELKSPPNHHQQRERLGLGIPNHSPEQQRETPSSSSTVHRYLLPQWGSRRRLRFAKNSKGLTGDDFFPSSPVRKTLTVRVDRKSVAEINRFDSKIHPTTTAANGGVGGESVGGGGYFKLRRRRQIHPSPPTTNQRVVRKSEIMRVQQANGVDQKGRDMSQERKRQKHNENGGGSSDFDCKKGVGVGVGGGSSSGSEPVPAVWPHKFVIALTNKEKEEDFMAIKGTKLPQRPKKRSKLIQRTLNAVSPGTWLCDLTLDRYEVKEKKTSKKTRRGLKAMGNKSSDSE